ncbi:MAG: hypothetical protein ABI778_00385, partial [Ignavibacteriota bacterium]
MQLKSKKILVGIVAAFFAVTSAGAQTTLTTAVPFLQIAPDARASGMGDGGTGVAD